MPLYTTLSATTARKLLHYDARTGELTWNVDRGSVKMGDEAGTIRPDGRVTGAAKVLPQQRTIN